MKNIYYLFVTLLFSMAIMSCNNDDEPKVANTEDLYSLAEGNFYESMARIPLLKDGGKWTDAIWEETFLGGSPYSVNAPRGFLFKGGKAYMCYDVNSDNFDWDTEETWYHHCNLTNNPTPDVVGSFKDGLHKEFIFILADLQLDKKQYLTSSNKILDGESESGVHYVLEEANNSNLTLRVEYAQPYYDRDGYRQLYGNVAMPVHFKLFESLEDARAYVQNIVANYLQQ